MFSWTEYSGKFHQVHSIKPRCRRLTQPRHLIFYPVSALLAIFCSILHTPSDPQATKDLGLLRSATGMMERVFLRQLSSVNEVIHIKLVADFVSELYRLARCAVDKAAHESIQ